MSDLSGAELDRRLDRLAEWRGRVVADLKRAKGPSNGRRALRNELDWAREAHPFLTTNRKALIARYAEALDADIRECEEIINNAQT